jgi:hypothetical protein
MEDLMSYKMAENNDEKIEHLRKGVPDTYVFHLIQGDSHEVFHTLMAEAKALAHKWHGTWELFDGSSTRPESLSVTIPGSDMPR